MQIFIYLIIISFLIRTIRNILYLTFLWQLKEYRLDRIFAHLQTPQGKNLIFGYLTLIKWILFIVILFFNFSPTDSQGYFQTPGMNSYFYISYLLFWIVWLFEAIKYIREISIFRWKLPVFTLKAIIASIIIFSITLFSFLDISLISTQARIMFLGPLIDRFLWLLVTITICLVNIPSLIGKIIIITLAKRKIANFPNLIVIGITGSYGKTSTKEFLTTILSEKFKVVKTPGFNNTDIGVAKCILKELKPEHEVFIVEMGAYIKGEIKSICDMVKPKIGIITGINEQHLELFGSVEKTMKAKFELIESLPNDGIAIFNGSNKYCLEMAEWAKKREIKTLIFNSSSEVKNIKIYIKHIEFSFFDKNKSYQFRVNLLGEQSIQNLLSAIHTAKSLGMKMEEIQKGAAKIVSPNKTMQVAGVMSGTTLVDDTFNANPDGVIAAVNFMRTFKGNKILVLTPLIELGNEAEKIHERLGREITKICDLVIFTNFNYSKFFISGAKKVCGNAKIHIVNALSGVKLLKENLGKDGIIVFEGKEAGRILNTLVKLD